MNIHEFLNCTTLSDFKNIGFSISTKYRDIINKYQKLYYTELCPPYFRLMPLVGTLKPDKQFRFCLIEFDNDTVFIQYKVIQLFNHQHIKVFDYPISLNHNEITSSIVFKHLKTLDFVRFITSTPSDEFKRLSRDNIESYDDFYYDLNVKNVLNSYHRHHHKITKLFNNSDFSVIMLSGKSIISDYQPYLDLWDEWCDGLLYEVGSQRKTEFKKFLMCNEHNFYKSVILYKGKPVSIRLWMIDNNFHIARSFYNVHNARTCSEEIKPIMRHISQIQKYLIAKYLKEHTDISRVYIAGAGYDVSYCKLRQHKEEASNGRITYYVCS